MSSKTFPGMEQILDRFDEAWSGPVPPRIEDHLEAADPQQRLALLVELVRIDLERRLAAGERVRLEDNYPPQRFPELYAETPAMISLVKHEFELRRRNEPELMLAEYLQRFPQCQTELLAHLPTVEENGGGEQQQQATEFTLIDSAATELDLRAYELIETLGKGGMGEVYRCGDPALGRDLAIKVMQSGHRAYPEIERRFLREARVTASLQHPGIVPVHNLGRLKDGRLHYTMRLVRGQTLAVLLKEEAGKPERLPHLLSIFERICQAVAYAHSKQVIHRDLKPANVMVGRFGEVQVMDWGLAKLLTAEDEPAAKESAVPEGTRIYTEAGDTPLAHTRLGREMGTPAYMPPEQALGEWDMVDERADVFALGSILCEILTGQPAYSGTDVSEVYRRAKRGDIAETSERLQRCGADAALTGLCRECLCPNHEARPRDAAVVANRVAEYEAAVQERLRHAEVERAESRAKVREERKKRRWVIAFLLVLLAGVAGSTWLAVRATIAERRALADRDDKEAALAKAEKSEADAKAVLEFFQDKVLSAGRPPGQEGGLGKDVTVRKAVDAAEAEIAKTFADRPLVEAAVRYTLGTTYWYLGDYTAAIQQHERALAIRESHLGLDHPDTLESRNNLGIAYQNAGRIDEAIRLHEQNQKLYASKLGPDHTDTLTGSNNLAVAYEAVGRFDEAIRLYEQTLKLREAKFGLDHPETLFVRNNLGVAYWRAGRTEDAVRLLEETRKQREAKLGPDHPDTLTSCLGLANAYRDAGRLEEATRLYEQTLKRREAILGPDHPHTLTTLNNLANAYLDAGRLDEAIRLHQQTLKQREDKLGADHPDTLASRNNLANLYRFAGRTEEAIRLHQQTLKQREARLGPDHPDTLTSRLNLAEDYDQARQFTKSEAIYRAVLDQTRKRYGAEVPATANRMATLSRNLLSQHKYTEAEPLLRDCLKFRLAKQPDIWSTFNAQSLLGEALMGQKKYTEAEPLLVQGYEGMKQRHDKIPATYRQVRLSEALERLVRLYEATDQKEKAADWRKQLQETKAPQKKTKP